MRCCSRLLALLFLKLDDVLNLAVESIAKSIKGFGADSFPSFDTIEGIGGETLLEDQVIFGQALFKKGFVERLVANH